MPANRLQDAGAPRKRAPTNCLNRGRGWL